MSGSSFTWTFVPSPIFNAPSVAVSSSTHIRRNALCATIEYKDVSTDRVRTGKLSLVHANASGVSKTFEFGQVSRQDTSVSVDPAVSLVGAGLCPCGTSPFGVGTLAISSAPRIERIAPRAVLRDKNTRDTVLDDSGHEMPMSPTDQRVFILLNTEFGSRSTDPTMGFKRPLRLTPSIDRETRDLVKQALMPAIEDHSIELLSVSTFYG